MIQSFRFAIASDLHIATPTTIEKHSQRFHRVEVSIPAFEAALQHIQTFDLDFLLLTGDLTQDGEPENHRWLQSRLAELPFPVYVIPGNHDVPSPVATSEAIAFEEFPNYYRHCGYSDTERLYYNAEILPGVHLVALNSNEFDEQGKQRGRLDEKQLLWLKELLPTLSDKLVLVAIHHNVIEHLPGQAQHPLARRYMLENAEAFKAVLKSHGVRAIFTGHLHVQDLAIEEGLYDLTTGSLISYPHPYRIVTARRQDAKHWQLDIESHRVRAIPGYDNLQENSREWLGDRSYPFMHRLLSEMPLSLSGEEIDRLAKRLRYFWADIAAGDHLFDFADFPPTARRYFQRFGAVTAEGQPQPVDNRAILEI